MNKTAIFGVGFGVIVLILLFLSVGVVPAGYIGVRTTFGAVRGNVNPGLYVQIPLVQNVVLMDTQTQKEQVDATAASNDLQQITATVAINFHVNPKDAGEIYQSIGSDYQNRVIDPAIQESIKSVTANYTAEELVTEREKAREDMLTLLTTKLQAFGVNMDSLNIVNFQFSDQYNQAIEDKVTAQQNVLTAEQLYQKAQIDASTTITQAEAQAEQIKIQAEAINSQGGADYVQLQAISKWNGTLPTYMTGNAPLPFLNLNSTN
jgi:regulator of protease activity HflC (stomatin/prohibitin superfamily)